MVSDLREFFEKHHGEFLKFDRIANKLSNRPDLHAFMMLDKLIPGTTDIVAGAEHDEIFLCHDVVKLLDVATEEQLIDLHRCGVRCDENGLCMFA